MLSLEKYNILKIITMYTFLQNNEEKYNLLMLLVRLLYRLIRDLKYAINTLH